MQEILKKYLSSRFVSVTVFIVAILSKIQLMRLHLDCGSDKLSQALMAKNYLEGHGLNINLSSITNLAELSYVPFNGWPPGYSTLIMPFLALSNNNVILSFFCIDIITAILFFIYLRKTLSLIGFPVWLTNLFILFQGFFLTIYIVNSSPTDFLVTALLLATVYYITKITQQPGFSASTTTGLTLFAILAAMMKYQNIAISFLLPGLLLLTGLIQKKKHWLRSGAIALGMLTLACGGLLLYQQVHDGSAFFIAPAKTGFFPGNILKAFPFVVTSFVNLDFYIMQLTKLLHTGYTTIAHYVRWISGILAIPVLVWYAWYLFKSKLRITNAMSGFMIFGGLAALAAIGILVMLSVTRSLYIGPPHFQWTYVKAGRYYSFVFLFIQVAAWWFLLLTPRRQFIKKVLAGLLVITVSVEILHGAYYAVKKATEPMIPLSGIMDSYPQYVAITKLIKEQRSTTGRKVVVATFGKVHGFLAGWYDCGAILTPLLLNKTLPKSSEPAVLLLVLDKKEIFLMTEYLKQPGVQLYTETEFFSLYTYYVEPTTGNKQ